MSSNLNLEFSISACSRQKRKNEIDKKDYHFLSVEEFKQHITQDDFIEWEEVYENNYYGTLKSEANRIWNNNNVIIFDVDVIGGVNLKKYFGNSALSIFIEPPSIQVLKERLINRKTESESTLSQRLDKAKQELSYKNKFDAIIVNDKLETACKEVKKIILSFLSAT